ncbi:hypothetical protein [Halomonas organivorans]|uniref:Uncharacterized protein n=1 Tax=Halomonas organivorans TaxID=257772 RepID=A0A7W5G7C6_9GAMM|nr:hypothetical protein [Halomonas organivorans]MBB3142802.1 hypothetical protein [Halomonas organivorans]
MASVHDTAVADGLFAAQHDISLGEATAYRRGGEARQRGARLYAEALSTYDAWYAAGWHDRDMAMGNRMIQALGVAA